MPNLELDIDNQYSDKNDGCDDSIITGHKESDKKNSSEITNQMDFTGERFVPEIDDPVMMMEHMQRYHSVRNIVAGLDILDVACGEGYGSNLMANSAKSVIGVDISEEAVNHAKKSYNRNNLSFVQGSATNLSMFIDGSFDAVVSFETIEHIDEYSQNEFLKEIKRVLKPNGFLIMSTPDKKIYSDLHNYHNEYHIHEFYKDEFITFLKKEFSKITLFIQYFEVTGILEKKSSDEPRSDIVMRFGNNQEAEGKYLIAIASDGNVPSSDLSSVYMNPVSEYNMRISRILQLQVEVEERNKHIHNLDEQIDNQSKYIVQLQNEIESRNNHINKLSERIAQLEEELNNHGIINWLKHKNKKKGA